MAHCECIILGTIEILSTFPCIIRFARTPIKKLYWYRWHLSGTSTCASFSLHSLHSATIQFLHIDWFSCSISNSTFSPHSSLSVSDCCRIKKYCARRKTEMRWDERRKVSGNLINFSVLFKTVFSRAPYVYKSSKKKLLFFLKLFQLPQA
jgi:hypothetical protein